VHDRQAYSIEQARRDALVLRDTRFVEASVGTSRAPSAKGGGPDLFQGC
jgi:hypothetical protein